MFELKDLFFPDLDYETFTESCLGNVTLCRLLYHILLFFPLSISMNVKRLNKQSHLGFLCVLQMSHSHRSRRNMFAAKDMRDFRHSCRVNFITFKYESGVNCVTL